MSWEDSLVSLLSEGLRLWDRVMAVPGARGAAEILLTLIPVSGCFWLLMKVLGGLALEIHDLLDRSLAVLFAVSYNLALGLLFSSVLALAILTRKGGTPAFLGYQLAAFVYIYLFLGAVYADPRTGRVDEYGLLGYIGALLSFLAFAMRPDLLANRATLWTYEATQAMKEGWAGRLVTAVFVFLFIRRMAEWGWRGFYRLRAPFIRRGRWFFFEGTSPSRLILGGTT